MFPAGAGVIFRGRPGVGPRPGLCGGAIVADEARAAGSPVQRPAVLRFIRKYGEHSRNTLTEARFALRDCESSRQDGEREHKGGRRKWDDRSVRPSDPIARRAGDARGPQAARTPDESARNGRTEAHHDRAEQRAPFDVEDSSVAERHSTAPEPAGRYCRAAGRGEATTEDRTGSARGDDERHPIERRLPARPESRIRVCSLSAVRRTRPRDGNHPPNPHRRRTI